MAKERKPIQFPDGPQPIKGKTGATIMGPRNPTREAENPDTLAPPPVDHGTMGNMRWSFADSHMHLSEGGWGRQTTIRELPTAPENCRRQHAAKGGRGKRDALAPGG